MKFSIFTARKRSLVQDNIFTPVCHSVHRGGVPQCMLGYHPPPRPATPPGADIPPGTRHPPWSRHTPQEQSMLGDTVNERAVRILLECNLVSDKFVKAELQPGTVDNILEFLQNKFWSSNKFENCGDYLTLFTLRKGHRTSKPKAGVATIYAIRSVMPPDLTHISG